MTKQISIIDKVDEHFMREAIGCALEAKAGGDYAIGAVIVRGNRIIAKVGNTRHQYPIDPTCHTELVAIRRACEELRTRYLVGCTLYSTHAPCLMCLGACVWSCIDRVVYGSTQSDMVEFSKKQGQYSSGKTSFDHKVIKWRGTEIEPEDLYQHVKLAHPTMEIVPCVLREECKKLYY